MIDYIADTFTTCFAEGMFPREWKKARLVLIPKGNGTQEGGIKARPIYLLNDIAKLFERIIASRIVGFMEDTPRIGLSDRQYGFRGGRSTVDALDFVASYIYKNSSRNHLTIAVSLDIRNAFNSISWPAVRHSLSRKGFPLYIRRIVDHYLFERTIKFPTMSGLMANKTISCGVPQGSVLGPLLWNLAFNYVLERRLEPGGRVICFADDTMIMAGGATVAEAEARVDDQISVISRRIEALGL